MNSRTVTFSISMVGLYLAAGCIREVEITPGEPSEKSAVIIGSIAPGGPEGKLAISAQNGCPDLVVTLNNNPVTIKLDDDCSFLIDDVQPAASVVLVVELPALDISGTIELSDVVAAELIEILVDADDESLSISVERRATPDPADTLPLLVSGNNVTIFIPAGVFDQTLTVDGNNFTLVGAAGDDCDDTGWSVITGEVLILKNNATFRNIRFEGPVEVSGNNAHFINTCIGDELLIFGNNANFDDDDEDDFDDQDDDD